MSFRGLLLADSAFSEANRATGTLTQDGLEAAPPVADSANLGSLELRHLAPETKSSATIELKAIGGGAASDVGRGASFAWRYSGEGSTAWRGSISPRICQDFRLLVDAFAGPGTGGVSRPAAVRLDDGTAIVAFWDESYTGSGVAYYNEIACWRFPGSGSAPQRKTILELDQSIYGTLTGLPTLLTMPGPSGKERLVCIVGTLRGRNPEPGPTYTLQVLISDDRGATWTRTVDGAAGYEITNGAPFHLRATYHAGAIVAFVERPGVSENFCDQIVSLDGGASWTLIEQTQTTGGGAVVVGQPEPLSTPYGLFVLYRDSGGVVRFSQVATGFDGAVSSASFGSQFAQITQANTGWAACLLEDGRIMVGFVISAGLNEHKLVVIDPAAPTKTHADDRFPVAQSWADTLDTGEHLWRGTSPVSGVLVACQGKALWAGLLTSNATATRSGLYTLELGGYQNVDWRDYGTGKHSTWGQIGTVYWPVSAPSVWAGLTVSASNVTATILADGLSLVDGAGTPRAYVVQRAFATGATHTGPWNRRVAWGRVNVSTGPSGTLPSTAGTNGEIFVALRDVDWWCDLSFGTDEVRLSDREAGASLGSASISTDTDYDYVVMVSNDPAGDIYARAWIRQTGQQVFTEVGGGVLATSGAGVALWQWGHTSSGSASRQTTWGPQYLSGLTANDPDVVPLGELQQATQGANAIPDLLSGAALTVAPRFLAGQRFVAGRGGVAAAGDTWTLGSRWALGAQRVDPRREPSPSAIWQTTDRTEQLLEWDFGSPAVHRLSAYSVGVALLEANFGQASLQRWDGSAWQDVVSIDRRSASIDFARTSDLIEPASGTPDLGRYVGLDELVGSWVDFGAGVVRKIVGNCEGYWSDPNTKPLLIQIEDLASVPSSGSCRLIWKDSVSIAHDVSASSQRWRLRIPASQSTASGVYSLGALVVGPLVIFGTDYSWGRQLQAAPNVQLNEDARGGRRPFEAGPIRRRVDFSWENVDETALIARTASAVTPSSTPAGLRNDTAVLTGLLYRNGGALTPLVYLPQIGSSAETIVGRDLLLYGRMVSPVSRRAILGDEWASEVHSVDAIVIEEEL